MMIRSIAMLLVIAGTLSARTEVNRNQWQWVSKFQVTEPGMVRLELPPEVLNASRADLGDLRIQPFDGEECPYLIEVPVRHEDAIREAAGFQVTLAGRTTVIEVSADSVNGIQAVELITPARDFLKSVIIEGRKSTGEWQTLASNAVIFRQPEGQSRLRVPLPAGAWERLRITADDERSKPVPFTGVRLATGPEKPQTAELPISVFSREELPGETRLTLDLKARNLNLAEVRFEIPGALFNRPCSVGYSTPSADGGTRLEMLGSGTLYRVTGGGGLSTEELAIPIHRRVPSRYLVVTLRNGDSPPLEITAAKATYFPTFLVFSAPVAGSWQLTTGAIQEKPPRYDLSALREAMANAGGEHIVPDPLRKNENFQRPPSLPGVETMGAAIDLQDWSRSRKVYAAASGVIRIELDAQVMANCRTDLGDIRLVQDGKQIPYVVRPGAVKREMKPSGIVLKNDPKRPTLSRWEITLPVDGLPATSLGARSASNLFSRTFIASADRKDPLGNAGTEELGTADWTKSGDLDAALVLNFRGSRLPQTFHLETDHGDNPPIPVDDVVIRFNAPSIVAKLASEAPLFLCYGNPQAMAPRYDLRLVWDELMAADQQATTLGSEELLRPGSAKPGAMDAGSPWLWLALAGVVIVLLVVVAKLLPRETAA